VCVYPQSPSTFWAKAPKHFEELTVSYMHPRQPCGTYLLKVSTSFALWGYWLLLFLLIKDCVLVTCKALLLLLMLLCKDRLHLTCTDAWWRGVQTCI
jgi:hypothetical protein